MSFPALRYEVDKHLVAGLRSLYEATDRLRQVPLDKLDPIQMITVREVTARADALKDALYALRMGRERTDDVPPTDLLAPSITRKLTPVTVRLYELLADGEWHDYNAVIREAAKEVLPGEAHRHMETKRTDFRAGETPPGERVVPRDDVWLVERGQRAIAVATVSGLARIEMDPPRSERSDKRKIRLRPANLARDRRLGNGEVAQPVAEPVADAALDAPEGTEVST